MAEKPEKPAKEEPPAKSGGSNLPIVIAVILIIWAEPPGETRDLIHAIPQTGPNKTDLVRTVPESRGGGGLPPRPAVFLL